MFFMGFETFICTRKSLIRLMSLVALFIVYAGASLSAPVQQLTGGIAGTVKDTSGAVVVGVDVKIVNTATNLTINAQTSRNGSYQIPNLPAGTYTVTFTFAGFKTEFHSMILVEGNRTSTVDGKLEVGGLNLTVEVAETPLLNQVDTTAGYVLSELAINNTPLGTGSYTQLAILAPGVSADFLNTSGTNAGLGNQAIWANGQRDTSNSFSVNGMTTNNLFNGKSTSQVASNRFTANTGAFTSGVDNQTNTSVYNAIGQSMATPAPETLQEVRVNTAMY